MSNKHYFFDRYSEDFQKGRSDAKNGRRDYSKDRYEDRDGDYFAGREDYEEECWERKRLEEERQLKQLHEQEEYERYLEEQDLQEE